MGFDPIKKTSLNTEIASITANTDTSKPDLNEKKTALKKDEKEMASLGAKRAKADAKVAEEAKKAEAESAYSGCTVYFFDDFTWSFFIKRPIFCGTWRHREETCRNIPGLLQSIGQWGR